MLYEQCTKKQANQTKKLPYFQMEKSPDHLLMTKFKRPIMYFVWPICIVFIQFD